jgi:hypothetical protein
MAIEVGELLVSIKADLTDLKKGLEDANKKVGEFGSGTVAKGTLIADTIKKAAMIIKDFGIDSLKAFGESQQATSKFELALRNTGQEVKQTSSDFQAYATELQRVTTFSDEAIMETGTLLTTFGLAGDELKKTTQAALDLSKGLGVDLRSATMLLGKAAIGETSSLARYGMTIDDNIPKSQRFEVVLGMVQKRFGGSAQNDINNVNGKLQNMANMFNDIQEKIGKAVLPAFEFWAAKMQDAIKLMDRMTGSGKKELQGRELTIRSLNDEKQRLLDNVKARGSYRDGVLLLTGDEQRRLVVITNAMIREKQLLQEGVAAQAQANLARTTDNADTSLRQKLMEEEAAKERKEAEEKEQKEREKRNKERADNFRDTLNFISTLAQEKNRTLAAIGKAASISVATIDTFEAANKALKSAPPPFNFALMAGVVAAGMANVARISGVKLARGGVVQASDGGTQATIGEGGSAEAVIPLEDGRSRKMLRDAMAGAGSGITLNFNISGQFIEGSPAKIQRMIRQAVLPEIRRYSEVNPQSSFIRRRGQR